MEQITHSDLVKALVKPPAAIIMALDFNKTDLWHGATGVSGEGGELLEAIFLYDTKQCSLEDTFTNVVEELGDLEFYLEQLRQRLGWQRPVGINAGSAIISPDMMLRHATEVAIHASAILDDVKKLSVYDKELDIQLLTIHMTAIEVAMDAVRLGFGISREETLKGNILKLSERYKGLQYTDKAAHERADKAKTRQYFGKPNDPVTVPHTASGLATPEE